MLICSVYVLCLSICVLVELPDTFRRREHAQETLLQALLAQTDVQSTAVTAPKSKISSQGMGGVGKVSRLYLMSICVL